MITSLILIILNVIRKILMLSAIVYPGSFLFFLIMFTPDVLDIVAPPDESRPRQLLLRVECFFDQEKYFYLVAFMVLITGFLNMTILMATETMYMMFLQHACGLLELTRWNNEILPMLHFFSASLISDKHYVINIATSKSSEKNLELLFCKILINSLTLFFRSFIVLRS